MYLPASRTYRMHRRHLRPRSVIRWIIAFEHRCMGATLERVRGVPAQPCTHVIRPYEVQPTTNNETRAIPVIVDTGHQHIQLGWCWLLCNDRTIIDASSASYEVIIMSSSSFLTSSLTSFLTRYDTQTMRWNECLPLLMKTDKVDRGRDAEITYLLPVLYIRAYIGEEFPSKNML